jgi:3-deoxy-D-manno-octulosonic-acid transferase
LKVVIYNISVRLYRVGVVLAAAMGNPKAKLWLQGRRDWEQHMRRRLSGAGPLVWVHAASLGEFEQGRPVLEGIRQLYPHHMLLLTFFSPSGYEVRKNYAGADLVCYLPLDTAKNARIFLEIARPQLAIFIKYEFWYHFLTELYKRNVPVLLVSGIFRPGQAFFKWYGGLFREMLKRFAGIFVQNSVSYNLLEQQGIPVILGGDTRFDRAAALLEESRALPDIETFIAGRKVLIAGSTWPSDERMLASWWQEFAAPDRCVIIAPHEIGESHIEQLLSLFPGARRFSEGVFAGDVLIIDSIGMLTALYRYARVTFVGGAFDKGGVHNVLEPATYSKPVVFGPEYHKYQEAIDLVEEGGGITVNSQEALNTELEALMENDQLCSDKGMKAGRFVAANKGATARVLAYIQEKRFLTRE